VNAYWAVVSARFRMLLQYRAAAAAGLGTQLFWGLIRVMIFEAFYRSSTAQHPISLPDVVTYVWLGQAFLGLQPWGVDRDIRDQIRSGTVAYELMRPLNLYLFWYARALAFKTAPTLLRSVPLLLIAGLFLDLTPPASWAATGAFLAATLGALLLSSAITTLMNISLLWTLSGDGVTALVPACVIVFSGMVVPLPLFPDWALPILNLLPFRGLVDVPFRLYLGHLPPGELLCLLGHQLAWTGILVLLGQVILSRGTRRLVVQGG